MKVYLAARFDRQAEMRERRAELVAAGHVVTSSWLDLPPPATDDPHRTPWLLRMCALMDLRALVVSDVLVAFAERESATWQSGGRHVEFGYALAVGVPVILVGEVENIFHHLPQVTRFDDWAGALAHFRGLAE